MKILYFTTSGEMGGAEKSLLDILASMRQAKPRWELRLVVPAAGPLASRADALGVSTTVLPFPMKLARIGDAGADHQKSLPLLVFGLLLAIPAVVSYVRKLRCVIREFAPDVMHTNGFKMHILGAWAKPAAVPLVWHIHDYVSARPLMVHLLHYCAPARSLALTNSRSVAADAKAVCGERLTVKTIYNGVDLESFSPIGPTLDLDRLSGLSPASAETVKVGMLATLAHWKGHETFLRAVSLLPRGLPVRSYVIGGALYQTNGSQRSLKELRRLADELGLLDRVGFTGFVNEPASAMRALDIVVHASTQPEPFGLVIAEGMACGRAVIVSQSGGAAELISAERDALGHAPGNVKSLAVCIRRLVTNAGLRASLGRSARQTAEQRFARTRLAAELIPLYESIREQRAEMRVGSRSAPALS
jgi:glycosyltransferase involved in cell wall biosynthesis